MQEEASNDPARVGINSMVVSGLGAAIPAFTIQRFVERVRESRAP